MLTWDQYQLGVAIFLGLFFGIPALLLLLHCCGRIRVVEQGTALVVERCGRFHRRCDGGLHLLLPFADQTRPIIWRTADVYVEKRWSGVQQVVKIRQFTTDVIDLRESVLDFPNQPVITRDNVELDVHPMLLYRLVDPARVAYETYDLTHAVEKLVQTTLRSIIGEMSLDDTLSSREEIERSLKVKIAKISFDWGLEIRSVELLEITPSSVVQEAMHKQLSAERIRRAAIVSADGQREKTKLEAEGDCQAAIALATGERQVAIVKAQGMADARRLIARAEADSVKIIAAALQEYGVEPTSYIIGNKYIESLASMSANAGSREVYFPLQLDVTGAMSVVAAGTSGSTAAPAAATAAPR